MLNLAKVICLLLVAKATSAEDANEPLVLAQKSCSDAIALSLGKLEKYHTRNLECVRTAILRMDLEKQRLHPELKSHAKREKFSRRVSKVMISIGNYTELMNETIDSLENIYETERNILSQKQRLADGCVPSYSDKILGKRRAIACINKVRESILDQTKKVKLFFTKMCKDAKKMSKSAVTQIKVLISSVIR